MVAGVGIQLITTVFIFLVVFNFLPACVAFVSNHPEKRLLAMLNVVSLFSFALWIALMVWAVGGRRDDSVINRFVGNRRNRQWLQMGVASFAAFTFGSTLGGLGLA